MSGERRRAEVYPRRSVTVPRDILRIGGVPYGLGAPLLSGLAEDPGVALVRTAPARLVTQLREGELDAALVSSIEGARRPGYAALEGLGIACSGPVRSVRAFRRRAATHIASVALTDESESSVALLRILLAQTGELAADCAFERVPSTRSPAALPHDLVLLIGDDGLRAEAGEREAIDLGERWFARTGLPFVFALWLIAPGRDVARVAARLAAAGRVAAAIVPSEGEARVHYALGAAEHRGLERFWDEAAALGLCDAACRPSFVSPRRPHDDVADARGRR